MISDIRALKVAVDTGEVTFGLRSMHKCLKSGKVRLVVLANNCPDRSIKRVQGVRVYDFPGTSAELGTACGKPFPISALAILEPGDSNILSL